MVIGLGELHKRQIIHRDIKPQNILMGEDGYVAITDFGLAKLLVNRNTTRTILGTAQYVAPEIIKGPNYDRMVDWWSFGVMIYEMLIGKRPFEDPNEDKLYEKIKNSKIVYPKEDSSIKINDEARNLIDSLLEKDPKKRFGRTGDSDEILAHPFFAGIDQEKLLKKQIPVEYKPDTGEIEPKVKPVLRVLPKSVSVPKKIPEHENCQSGMGSQKLPDQSQKLI